MNTTHEATGDIDTFRTLLRTVDPAEFTRADCGVVIDLLRKVVAKQGWP